MTVRKWIGLLVGFAGSLPVLIAQTPIAELSAGKFLFLSIPEICLLIAATSGVYGWIVMKKLVVNKHYSPIFVNGFGMFFGGLAAFITSFLFEQKPLLKCAQDSTNSITYPIYQWEAHGSAIHCQIFSYLWDMCSSYTSSKYYIL